MDSLSVIEHSPFSTSLLSSLDKSALYTITSRRHHGGFWADVVYRIEREDSKHPNLEKQDQCTELATVFYIDAGTTRVRFRGNLGMEAPGEQGFEEELEVDLDAFLRRRNPYSNSRIFMGPDGVTYKWRIDGKKLELFNTATHTLIARFNPRRSKNFLSLPFPGMARHNSIVSSLLSTVRAEHTASLLHPTLSLHPTLLSLESDLDDTAPQLRDAIVLTFVIMQRLLKERLQYRHP